jgi:2-keto-4-pentenoate hydratase/2-oxohepta-3-ene-1,7-dioic acid hydratase in catechol pathway
MHFVRYALNGTESWGQVATDGQIEVVAGDPLTGYTTTGEILEDRHAPRWLPPALPTKIVAVGLNYRDHAAESGKPVPDEPMIFMKPPSSLVGHLEAIELPTEGDRIDHEAELAIIVGRRCRDVAPDNWRSVVLGFTCANDVSHRDFQRKDRQFARAKGFDTFCPLGRELTVGVDPSDLRIECSVNGVTTQSSRTNQLVFDVGSVVNFVSRVMTLEPWDVILTGTPSGVSPLSPSDVVDVRIEGVGSLSNPVVSAARGT